MFIVYGSFRNIKSMFHCIMLLEDWNRYFGTPLLNASDGHKVPQNEWLNNQTRYSLWFHYCSITQHPYWTFEPLIYTFVYICILWNIRNCSPRDCHIPEDLSVDRHARTVQLKQQRGGGNCILWNHGVIIFWVCCVGVLYYCFNYHLLLPVSYKLYKYIVFSSC